MESPLQSLNESSTRQKELIQLIVVVILIGLISNIVASYLATYSFYGLSVGVWLVPILILLVSLSVYMILYPKEVNEVAIYTNLMVDKKMNCIHLSPYSPFGVQHAELFWKALEQDKSPYANQILTQLHNSDSNKLELDFIECVAFLILSGFEPLWASHKIKYYGYPTYPSHLGEVSRLSDSTIYRIQKDEVEFGNLLNFKNLEFRNLLPLLENNQVVKHFLGNTSLDRVYKPDNWLIFTPKGTQISIEYKKHCRIIHFSHRYFTTSLTISKNSVASGLPYGIRIKEPNYDEKRYFSADFRMDFQASFSRLLLIRWGRVDYYNWVRLLRQKLVASFALDETVFLKEIE
jgi:hypothetical protein